MKKLVIVALSAVLAVMAVEPAHAQDQRVLAIIDTAVDSKKIPAVIHEVCFTVNRSCPNKTSFMEGAGAANSSVWPSLMSNATYHGHKMTQAALAVNPNVKIVFVRIADITAQGNSGNQPQSLSLAIDWVSKNASKYSIDAVSISQSGTSSNNLLSCSRDTVVINAVASLNALNVPTFAATGNNRSQTMVGFPSCVNGVIGVGALAAYPQTPTVYANFAAVTNRGPGLDLVAPGDISIVEYNGRLGATDSTSGATVIAASSYVKSNQTTFTDFVTKLVNVLGYPYVSK
jgi:hypothetical protein